MKIIVALSGGVDSSVAAALLQEQGHEVEGIFMKNWSPETIQTLTDCPWEQDQADAAAVCEKLGIPFRSINFEKEYKERVVDYFLAEYAAGRTPNPDIMCNKEIKFAAFLRAAQDLGADKIATGHYARIREKDGRFELLRGLDTNKDQSYFLYTLGQEQLSRTLLPLGELQKTEVRKLAEKFGLPTAAKKDSQGICFIGHIDLKKFLMAQIPAQPGNTYLVPKPEDRNRPDWLERSRLVGAHQGMMYYTLGERSGTTVDNGTYKLLRGQDVPHLYVIGKDIERNRLYVSELHEDPFLFTNSFSIEKWIPHADINQAFAEIDPDQHLTVQVRYRDQDPKEISSFGPKRNGDTVISVAGNPGCWAVAPGQSVVVYNGDRVLGGGVVDNSQYY